MLACLLANPNRDSKKKSEPYTPDDFNPYAVKKPEVLQIVKPSVAAAMFFSPRK